MKTKDELIRSIKNVASELNESESSRIGCIIQMIHNWETQQEAEKMPRKRIERKVGSTSPIW